MNEMDILTVSEIANEYNYDKHMIYRLLNLAGAPIMFGGNNTKFHITRKNWESWVATVKNGKAA